MYSRRDFAKLALGGVPLSAALAASSAVNGVQIGATTFSFREFPRTPGKNNVDAVIQALQFAGVTEVELSSADLESPVTNGRLPAPGAVGAYSGAVQEITPADRAVLKTQVRDGLRKWRLSTPPEYFTAIRGRFDAAGISLFAYTVDYDEWFTDEEIESTFRQAEALGVGVIASSTTLPMARRLAPFAEKHRMLVALHNSPAAKGADVIATPAGFFRALALSKNFRIDLDTGNFTAANGECVAFIQENHENISHLTLKDRARDGAVEAFGQGDTPIKPVLALLKEKKYSIPVFVEYEYLGLGTAREEVKKCLAFVRSALS
jgi:sugar phosphate isomerase/epimerase